MQVACGVAIGLWQQGMLCLWVMAVALRCWCSGYPRSCLARGDDVLYFWQGQRTTVIACIVRTMNQDMTHRHTGTGMPGDTFSDTSNKVVP